ncbi:conserved hypothetical protein [Trichinella spiralis]|uniref:hypothetical protein n=1 Tax=Trichinella spiralis TaxID=6334 RepID=UPI0001EFC303|nr:conserved hypothetical protein [Trichinella spiralis]
MKNEAKQKKLKHRQHAANYERHEAEQKTSRVMCAFLCVLILWILEILRKDMQKCILPSD